MRIPRMLMTALMLLAMTMPFAHAERHTNKPGRMFSILTDRLNLTPDQQSQLKPLVDAREAQLKSQWKANREEMRAVLTDAQRTRLDQMMAERRARLSDRCARKQDGSCTGQQGAADSQGSSACKAEEGKPSGPCASAGTAGANKHNRAWKHGDREAWMRSLDLTDEQKTRLATMRDRNRAQMKAEREQFNTKVMALLTPDQKAKFEEMGKRHRLREASGRHEKKPGSASPAPASGT